MASFKDKSKFKANTYADGSKYTHPSKKHYRVHHYRINKKLEHYDNDTVWVVMENDKTVVESDIVFGINKDRWKASDCDYNDHMKDGN